MLSKDDFRQLLQAQGALTIDGALATELEVRGHNLNHALWSAKVVKDSPASIRQVHLDYYLAGADIAITASYQASPQGLHDHFGMSEADAKELVARSVQLAFDAREAALQTGGDQNRKLLVAGSVGPYGAYLADGSEYRGDYSRTAKEFDDFHRPRIQALVDTGVDLLALETIPSIGEIEALLALLQREFPTAIAWLSCTSSSPEALSDGTPWKTVLDVVHQYPGQILAYGVNCVPLTGVTDTLKTLSKLTHLPLVCYPNSGESWDADSKTWQGQRPDDEIEQGSKDEPQRLVQAQEWFESGARLIGGCCRTGPAFIRAVHDSLEL